MAIGIDRVLQDLHHLAVPTADVIAQAIWTTDPAECSPDATTLLGLRSLSDLSKADIRVWVVGGWVGDVYSGKPLRQHGDIDLLAMAEEQDQVLAELADLGCRVDPQNEWQHGRREFRLYHGDTKIDLHFLTLHQNQRSMWNGAFEFPADLFSDGRRLLKWDAGSTEVLCVAAELAYIFQVSCIRLFGDFQTRREKTSVDLKSILPIIEPSRLQYAKDNWRYQGVCPWDSVPRPAVEKN